MYTLLHLIIYTRAGVCCPRCGWCPRWWLVVSSVVAGGVLGARWCPRCSVVPSVVWMVSSVAAGGALGGGWWCPRWLAGGALGGWLVSSVVWMVSSVVAGGVLGARWCPRWHICNRHPSGHATRALSAAGSLASESKFQGRIDECDCSNYQLFRCPFKDMFYKTEKGKEINYT